MSDLYSNPALRQRELNRQGSLEAKAPDTAEIMDSVFFNIENNTFKIWKSNREGAAMDEQAGSLLDPKDVWAQYGVKTETPISTANAERMRDNMDSVAERNYNLSFLEHTSFNQARTFLNGVAGPILTDPVQIGLSLISAGAISAASKALGTSSAIASAARLATSTPIGRIASAGAIGATEGLIEGFIESEILKDQAPKAGLQFSDEDYWNNVRANVLFSSIAGGARQAFGEFRSIKDQKAGFKAFTEAEANKIPRDIEPLKERFTDNSIKGDKVYTTHFSNSGNFDFATQTPVSKTHLGKGYQFSSSKDWAFSDKGFGTPLKESIFEMDIKGVNLNLLDAELPLNIDLKRKMLDVLKEDLGDLPDTIVKQLETSYVTPSQLSDILSSIDNMKGTDLTEKMASIVKSEGFNGYSFLEDTLDAEGNPRRGLHLFEMPEGTSVNHLNPTNDIPTKSLQDMEQLRIEQQKALDYYASKESNVDYNKDFEVELSQIDPELPPPIDSIKGEMASIKEVNTSLVEEATSLGVEISDTIEPEKAREIAKAIDFCVRN